MRDQLLEELAAFGITGELIKTSTGWREQYGIACLRRRASDGYSFAQIAAVAHGGLGADLSDGRFDACGLVADQQYRADGACSNARAQGAEVSAFRGAAGDEQ